MRVLEDLLADQPHCPDLRLRLGRLYSMEGYDEEARGQFQSALALHPDFLEARIAAGRHEMRMGRSAPAAAHLHEAVAINQQHVQIYAGLALAMLGSNRAAQAAEFFATAARQGNNTAVLLAQLGRIEAVCSRWDGRAGELPVECDLTGEMVEEQVERDELTLAARPGWHDARIRQAMLLRLLGRGSDAAGQLRRVLREEPHNREAWLQLGLCLLDSGQDHRPVIQLALGPDALDARCNHQLSLAYCSELEFELTLERLEMDLEHGPDICRKAHLAIDAMRLRPSRMSQQTPRGSAEAVNEPGQH
jgi:tetratricopeptide (TPR) repeat protein